MRHTFLCKTTIHPKQMAHLVPVANISVNVGINSNGQLQHTKIIIAHAGFVEEPDEWVLLLLAIRSVRHAMELAGNGVGKAAAFAKNAEMFMNSQTIVEYYKI